MNKKIQISNLKNIKSVNINPGNEYNFDTEKLLFEYKATLKEEIKNYAEKVLSFKIRL